MMYCIRSGILVKYSTQIRSVSIANLGSGGEGGKGPEDHGIRGKMDFFGGQFH